MQRKIYQVDAFTDELFHGNPAAVCPLDKWLPDGVMQAIANENQLSETAFFVPAGEGYELRWFTPVAEVDLCGHATLASAYVLYEQLGYAREAIRFQTRSGELTVWQDDGGYAMRFPKLQAQACVAPVDLINGLGVTPERVLVGDDYMAVFASQAVIEGIQPDFTELKKLDRRGVIVTAPGEGVDFVSRFFAPKYGIDEDPVTGSAHCLTAPYWAEELDKTRLSAWQLSRRGGQLECCVLSDAVELKGHCALYMEGIVRLPH